MKSFLNRLSEELDSLKSELDNTATLIREQVGKLPVLASLERGEKAACQFDEKHYFVIPNFTSDTGFSLHTMRYLPNGVPEVNELTKRRIFHFPNEHYEGTLRYTNPHKSLPTQLDWQVLWLGLVAQVWWFQIKQA